MNKLLSFTVDQVNFLEAVSLAERAVAKHSVQPVLSNILLKASSEKQTLQVMGTDLDLGLAASIPASIEVGGEITLPAQKFNDMLSTLPSLQVELVASIEGLVNVRCGGCKFQMKGLTSETFPQSFVQEASQGLNDSLQVNKKDLENACRLVPFAIDRKNSSNPLGGVSLIAKDNLLEFAATDSTRLSRFQCLASNVKTEEKIVVPAKIFVELIRMLGITESECVNISLSNSNKIIFYTDKHVLSGSLLAGNYPSYQSLIPSKYACEGVVNRQSLIQCLNRASILADERTKIINFSFHEQGILNISSASLDLGSCQDQLDLINYSGSDINISFNVFFLLDCLKNLSCEDIVIKMNDPVKPLVVEPELLEDPEKEPEFLYILMPLKNQNKVNAEV